jgi:hypothetical protein
MVGLEICHSHPVCLRVGGQFFAEAGQKEVYALIARTLVFLRPELVLFHRLSPQRLEALFQAALGMSVSSYRALANPEAVAQERAVLEKTLSEQARAALVRMAGEYLKTARADDFKRCLVGAELSATRASLLATGDLETVKRAVTNGASVLGWLDGATQLRELMCFAVSADFQALRAAIGVNIEIPARK